MQYTYIHIYCQPNHCQMLWSACVWICKQKYLLFSDAFSGGLLINLSWILNNLSLKQQISNVVLAGACDQLGSGGPSAVSTAVFSHVAMVFLKQSGLKTQMSQYVLNLETVCPKGKEAHNIVQRARLASAPGSNGLPCKIYRNAQWSICEEL